MRYMMFPYSHPDPRVRAFRAKDAAVAAAALSRHYKMLVYSSVTHGHALAEAGLDETWDSFWRDASRSMLCRADGVDLVRAPGWRESVGIHTEVHWCATLWIPKRPVTVWDFEIRKEKGGRTNFELRQSSVNVYRLSFHCEVKP